MIGNQDRWQEDLFVAGPLSGLIPDDHILRRVDKILDLSWLRKELAGLYSETHGRPSIDPEAAVRRGLANVAIQVYLTAAVMNLKRLAAFAGDFYREIIDYLLDILAVTEIKFSIRGFLGNSETKYFKSC